MCRQNIAMMIHNNKLKQETQTISIKSNLNQDY
jgi:hypothetical protein